MEYNMTNDQILAVCKTLQDKVKVMSDECFKYRLENNSNLAEYYEGKCKAFEESIKITLMFSTRTI